MIPENAHKLSLIVLAYNEEAVLPLCLDAIANQTIKPYEVIVVNNNSTDATERIAQSYPFVKVVNETTQGMIAARNKGFSEAKGNLLGRIDADTVIGPHWVERVLNDFTKFEIDGLTGPGAVYEVSDDEAYAWQVFSKYNFALHRRLFGFQVLWGSNMVIKKKAWQKISSDACHNERLVHEDLDLSVLIHNYGGVIMYDRYLRVHIHGVRFLDPRKVAMYHRKAVKTRNYHIKKGSFIPNAKER
jgi:glycosyltransferase involved in cell wall biosynthesis